MQEPNSLPLSTSSRRIPHPHNSLSARCSSRGATPEKGGVRHVQYAKMVALIEDAELAGERETEFVNDQLADAFESWINQLDLGEITEEEEDALRLDFEKGFGICVHHPA